MLKELLDIKKSIEERMETLQDELYAVMRDINDALSDRLVELRKLQGKEFGTVNMQVEGFKVTETITKKVEWDQGKMSELFDRIAGSGGDPRAYMKVKLEVGEKAYDSFPPEIQSYFSDCRTVKPGKPVLKFEEVANA